MELIQLPENLKKLSARLSPHLDEITNANKNIKEILQEYADGKKLKGDEIVGWLGEVYGKLFLNGKLVSDEFDYDVAVNNDRVSVKARNGTRAWNQSSTIPKIDGEDCPTHLMFIQFFNDYSLPKIWLFPWEYLRINNRFKRKIVRREPMGYYIRINEKQDKGYLKYYKS